MKTGLKISTVVAASALSLLLAGPAVAAPIPCENTDDDRHMLLTPDQGDAVCAGSGSGMNDNREFHWGKGLGVGDNDKEPIEKLEDDYGTLVGDWFTIHGLDETSGTIEFVSNLYDQYDDLHVAFKFGHKHTVPDWMSYSIDGVLSADWEVTGKYALSNVAIWGKDSPVQVPAPGALGLLGIGLIGLFVALRRRYPVA